MSTAERSVYAQGPRPREGSGWKQRGERTGMFVFTKGLVQVYSGHLETGRRLVICDGSRPDGVSDIECRQTVKDFGMVGAVEIDSEIPIPVKVRTFVMVPQ